MIHLGGILCAAALRQRSRLGLGSLPGRGRDSPNSSSARCHSTWRIGPSRGRGREASGCGGGAMLTAGRGDRRPTTSTDCHAGTGAIIVPRGDTAVTMPTATACSPTDSPSTATTSSTSSASTAAPSTPASTTTPAMRERGRYRQGSDGKGEREHSKHCHVGTAFLRLEIGTLAAERASPKSWRPSARPVLREKSITRATRDYPGQPHGDTGYSPCLPGELLEWQGAFRAAGKIVPAQGVPVQKNGEHSSFDW